MTLSRNISTARDPRQPARSSRFGVSPAAFLVLPLIVFLGVFYAYPLLAMLSRAVHDDTGWTIAVFPELMTNIVFWRVLWITGQISLIVTAICVVLAYPLAYWLARLRPSRANIVIILVLVPFWTSILVRTYAWMALLGRRGIVNDALVGLGLADAPMRIMNTRFAVCLAMVHVLLPFMVLPIYANLRRLDWNLARAAGSLGAGPWATFRQVILPLSLPGVVAGALIVLTLAIGFYITPVLVGSGSDIMISMLIGNLVDQLAWPRAAAMAAILLAIVLLVLALAARLVPLERVFGGQR